MCDAVGNSVRYAAFLKLSRESYFRTVMDVTVFRGTYVARDSSLKRITNCFWFSVFRLPQFINLLNPTGHMMHQQFNIQQLYAPSTLYLCVLYLSENKQRLVPLTALTDWFL